jgi:hypothetical protein
MKTWIITLPFLCAVGVAMAQGVEKEGVADQPQATAAPAERAAARIAPTAAQATSMPNEPVATPAEPTATPGKAKAPVKAKTPAEAKAPAKAPSRSRMGKRSPKTLPTGDMRHCLDLKTRAETIRCSETRPKK